MGAIQMAKKEIGKITHYFDKISVGVIELIDALKVGDKISIEGHGNVVEQAVDSMQVEHQNIEQAKAGDAVGLKVNGTTKKGDKVYLVTEE